MMYMGIYNKAWGAVQVDELTGLGTFQLFEQDVEEALQKHESVGVALLDVDQFMTVNDDYGHETGDRVLKGIADVLKTYFVKAYRVAGDEFAALMPGQTLEQAFLVMEKVRQTVEESQEAVGAPQGRTIHISAGVSQYPRDAKEMRGLIRAADAALHNAKEMGSNQVSLPSNNEMVMKTCYYASSSVRQLSTLAESLSRKESVLLREALDDLLRKYDPPLR